MLSRLSELLSRKLKSFSSRNEEVAKNQIKRISLPVNFDSYNFDQGPTILTPTEFDQNLLAKKVKLIKKSLDEAKRRAETIIMELNTTDTDNQDDTLAAIADAADKVVLSGRKILAGDSFMLAHLDDQIDMQLPDLSKIKNLKEANKRLNELLSEIAASEEKLADYLTESEISEANRVSAAINMRDLEEFLNCD